jgi:YhcH/YjgK/YiaL family protein
MIVDSLKNLEKYVSLNPLFAKVVEYINNNDLNNRPEGKELIDGEDLFANFCMAEGKSIEAAKLETHDKMIDIQIPLNCPETMGYTPRESLPMMEYDSVKDLTFYDDKAQQYVTIFPGMFAIFFPQDGHAPCISDTAKIKKVIFKVKA